MLNIKVTKDGVLFELNGEEADDWEEEDEK